MLMQLLQLQVYMNIGVHAFKLHMQNYICTTHHTHFQISCTAALATAVLVQWQTLL